MQAHVGRGYVGIMIYIYLILILIILASNILFWFIIYTTDIKKNYESGFEEGRKDMYPIAFNLGFDDGNQSGFGLGRDETYPIAFNLGFDDGNQSGFDLGYLSGVKDGAGRGYNIRDPTYEEMMKFIMDDSTNQNEYSYDYNCYDFTNDVCNNAFKEGYKCGSVYIDFPNDSHAIICFNTTDNGLIFIEPQSDTIMNVSIGINYWNKTSSYNDMIVRYDIIW